MKRTLAVLTISAVTAAGGVAALASDESPGGSGLRAGVGTADATWHVGAGAGQYASEALAVPDPEHPDTLPGTVQQWPDDVSNEWDPNVEHVKQASSYGVASRLSVRALVLQDAEHAPVALVKIDNYLAQDYLTRRIADILAAHGSKVSYDHILLSATHNHNSPYYATPSAGVWAFQDVMDLRMFEYQARQAAAAIEQAESHLVPARVGATTVDFPDFQGNIAGADLDNDGAPAGYGGGVNDHGLVVMRFDDVSDPAAPKPLATYVNYAEHGESLDGYDLISEDWWAPFERYVDRATGVPTVFSQGSVGSAEGPYGGRYGARTPQLDDHGDTVLKAYAHMGYAQAERGTHLLANRVLDAWNAIGGAQNGVPVQVPYQYDPTVDMLTNWVAGPVSHPYPSVGNCRTRNSVNGDPGAPAAGLPDCQRGDFGEQTDLYQQLKAAGLPLPDNYDATSFSTVEENLRIKLQAVRIGDILLASCSCEAQSDLIKNLESRTDAAPGNIYDGFDWADQRDVDDAFPLGHVDACYQKTGSTDYSCPDPSKDFWFGSVRTTVSKEAFDHMEAEVHNDAKGWNDPDYVAQANSEPTTLGDIKGNFTKEELGGVGFDTCNGDQPLTGYPVAVGLGHTGDYDGYTVSYREYMARDAYRKALTSYGPHTADYMNTNLVSMAAHLKCASVPLLDQPTAPLAAADELRQVAEAKALGELSSYYFDTWSAQIPDSAGPARPLDDGQPWDIERFDVTQFRWVGGDNWTDNPVVKVQRLVDGDWQFYADQTGEVQTFLDQPGSFFTEAPAYRGGTQEWHWRASFEAFDSYPRADVPGGQVPTGTYRFVVDGQIHSGGGVQPYHLDSDPFRVQPWDGIAVQDLRRNGDRASFTVAPISYPVTPKAAHADGIRWYCSDEDQGCKPAPGAICLTCSFRPWARTGEVATAAVEVRDGAGKWHRVPATYDADSGRWVAEIPGNPRTQVRVPVGGVVDSYGEVNGTGLGPIS